jgi:hypothetical protein
MKKQLEEWNKAWFESEDALKEAMGDTRYARFKENQQMIDLRYTPKKYVDEIIKIYRDECNKDIKKNAVFSYLTKNRCRQLIGCVKDFTT